MNEVNNTQAPEEVSIDLLEIFHKLLNHWRWFMISVPVCLFLALIVCIKWTPIYSVSAKVMINDPEKGQLGANMMMKDLNFLQTGDLFIENEMVELQSKNLIQEVVKELELNIRYVRDDFPRDQELYTQKPIQVLVDHPENIRDTLFVFKAEGPDSFTLENEQGDLVFQGKYAELIPMKDYQFSVEKTDSIEEKKEIYIYLNSYRSATDEFSTRLQVKALGKNTRAIEITITDPLISRGRDFVSSLINCYNRNGVTDNQLVSTKTVEFINERLKVINRELGTIENDAERFKKENRITDLSADAEMIIERKKSADAELLKLQTELAVVESIRTFLAQNGEEEFRLLPENLGLTDAVLTSGITQYNEMVLRRSKLMLTANESNPILIGLGNQLRDLKTNIRIAIANVEKSQKIKISRLQEENQSVDKMMTSVPTQEKQYRAIARQQELKENLFLFLMQKREETEIAKLMYVPAAKIIESPLDSKFPVSPKKKLILLAGLFMGLFIPVGVVLMKGIFNTTVETVEEVEHAVSSPVLGSLPLLPEGKTDIFHHDLIFDESMQMIREKLNYMLPQSDCQIIMVTSTVPSEGKSLVSAHLANAYAEVGKKVLAIGCDLRNPQLNTYFNKHNTKGLSAYLAGMANEADSLIEKVTDHLDLLFGGVVPPNPTQLINSKRMEDLLKELSQRYDYIFLDTPPIGILADGLALSRYANACIYVVRVGVLERNALKAIVNMEKEKRIKNSGIVVNGINISQQRYGYGYGYRYKYGSYYQNKKKD